MPMSQAEKDDLDFRLGTLFKPTMPINREDLFSGRRQQVREVLDGINQHGQHVILYGERGVGKTSLANMIFFRVECTDGHLLTPHINCTSGSSYSDLWIAVLNDIEYRARRQTVVLPKSVKRTIKEFQTGSRTDFAPDLAQRLVKRLWDESYILVVVIFDEFDTVLDEQTRLVMSETVKYFSDKNTPGTIVLVGVADDVESLISQHQSVERCLRQVRMPRMSRDEIEDIVTNPLNSLKMSIEQDALHEVSRIAVGLPHYAHLLGLHAGRQAVHDGSYVIQRGHVMAAIQAALNGAHVTIHNAYFRATVSSKKNALYKEVLLASALAETNQYGYFSPSDIRAPLERILKRSYGIEAFARHLHAFCEPERGPVLKKADLVNRPRFRFANPLMQPFVLMKGLDDRTITEDDLRATRDVREQRLF